MRLYNWLSLNREGFFRLEDFIMNKRQRKKWLKQHKKYINPRETWSLDVTIANFVYPRLKKV